MTFYEHDKNEEEKRVDLDLLPSLEAIQPSCWQLVRKIEATGLAHLNGKLGPKWDGPYKVIEVIKLET